MAARSPKPVLAIIALLVFGVLLSACGDDADAPAATATAAGAASAEPSATTSGASQVTVIGPLPADEALAEPFGRHGVYVVEVDTRLVYFVSAVEQARASWEDNDTLLASVGEQTFRVGLAGDVEPASVSETPTRRSEPPTSATSPDGVWTATKEKGPFTGQLVGVTGEEPRYRITNANAPFWSDADNRLAVLGNLCFGRDLLDLFVFDPATEELRNLTADKPIVFDFMWRPGGAEIAVDLIEPDGRLIIGLVDTETADMELLVDVEGSGDLPLVGWNPSGTRLMFGYNAGRGACEIVGRPGVPTPEETRLEPLGD